MTSPAEHGGVNTGQVKSLFERWGKLEEEKAAISDDLKDLFAEAKANGYNGRALRAAFRHMRKLGDAEERLKLETDNADFELYVGALSGTNLAPKETTRGTREAVEPKAAAPAPVKKPDVVIPISATVTPIRAPAQPAEHIYDESVLLDAVMAARPDGLEIAGKWIEYSKEADALLRKSYVRQEDNKMFYNVVKVVSPSYAEASGR